MTHKEKANQYFCDKFHCSQVVLAAFAEGAAYATERKLFTEFCPKMVESAVEITEGIIAEMEAGNL